MSIGKTNLFFIKISIFLMAFGLGATDMRAQSEGIEGILFDETFGKLGNSIKNTGRKQAIYAYIIANATTPELDLAALLPPDDRAILIRNMPEGQDNMDVILEFVMARIGENTKRQNAYILLMKKKMDVLRQVISKGQR